MRNWRGPRIEPWGTPWVISARLNLKLREMFANMFSNHKLKTVTILIQRKYFHKSDIKNKYCSFILSFLQRGTDCGNTRRFWSLFHVKAGMHLLASAAQCRPCPGDPAPLHHHQHHPEARRGFPRHYCSQRREGNERERYEWMWIKGG